MNNILEFNEERLSEALKLHSTNIFETSTLAGIATYNQHRSQNVFRSNETIIFTTGNSQSYRKVLQELKRS